MNQKNMTEETEETDEECNESYEENSDSDNLSQDDYNPPSIKLFKKIMIDILRGSEEIHSKNLIHTDLKFENIMIDILDENIRNVIEVTDKLNICEKYNNLIIESLPENYSEFDKMKRKKLNVNQN